MNYDSYQDAYKRFVKEAKSNNNFAWLLRTKFYTKEELAQEASQQMKSEDIFKRIFDSLWAFDAELCVRNPRLAAYTYAIEYK